MFSRFKSVPFNMHIYLLTLQVFLLLYLLVFNYSNLMYADSASDIILAMQIVHQKTLLPRTFFYPNEIFIFGNYTIIAIFYSIFYNIYYAKILASIVQVAIFMISLVYLSNSLHYTKSQVCFLLFFLLSFAFGFNYLDIMLSFNAYTLFISFYLFLIGFLIRYEENKMNLLHLFIALLFCFIYGVQSSRVLVPLMSLLISFMIYKVIYRDKLTKIILPILFIVMSLVGIIISKLYIEQIVHHSFRFSLNTLTISGVFENLYRYLNLYYLTFTDNSILNTSITFVFGFILFLIVIVTLIYSVFNKLDKGVIFIKVLLVVSFFATMLSFLIINVAFTNRYIFQILTLIVIFISPVLVVKKDISSSTTEGVRYQVMKNILLFLVLSSLMVSNLFVAYGVFKDKKFNNIRKLDLIPELLSSNLVCGYATYWNADDIQILSNNKLKVLPLTPYTGDRIEIKPFLWLMDDNNFHGCEGGYRFIILKKDEIKQIINRNILLKGQLVIDNQDFLVYKFNKDPFIYINEDATSFDSQVGINCKGNLCSTNVSGFMAYGPYSYLPQGEYSVSFMYRSNTGTDNRIGYVDINNSSIKYNNRSDLYGTNGVESVVQLNIDVSKFTTGWEYRVFYESGNLELINIKVN